MTDVALQPYVRYQPTPEEQRKARDWAVKFVGTKSRLDLISTFTLMVLENLRLTQEVKDHRQARGFEPLPEHPL